MTAHPQRTVLVVDDEPMLVRFMVGELSLHGFTTIEATNATEALRLFGANQGTIGLAIIDMMMPGMSGLDLAAELSRLHPNPEILYISGYASSVAMEGITCQRPEAVLLKPFNSSMLIERVQRLLPIGA